MGRQIMRLIPPKNLVGRRWMDRNFCLEKTAVLAARIAARFFLDGLNGLTVSLGSFAPTPVFVFRGS